MESCDEERRPLSRGGRGGFLAATDEAASGHRQGQGPAPEVAHGTPAPPVPEQQAAPLQAQAKPQPAGGGSGPCLRQSPFSQQQLLLREQETLANPGPSPAASPTPAQGGPSPGAGPAPAGAEAAGGGELSLAAGVEAPAAAAAADPPPGMVPSLEGVHPRILHLALLLFSNPCLAQQLEHAMMAVALAVGAASARGTGGDAHNSCGADGLDLPLSAAVRGAAAAAAAAAAGRAALLPRKPPGGPGAAGEAPEAAVTGARGPSPASVLPGGAPAAGRGSGESLSPKPDGIAALEQLLTLATRDETQAGHAASQNPAPLPRQQQDSAQQVPGAPPPPNPFSTAPHDPWADPLIQAYLRSYRPPAGQQQSAHGPPPPAFPRTPHRSTHEACAEISGEFVLQQQHHHHDLQPQAGGAAPPTPLVPAPLAQHLQHAPRLRHAQQGQQRQPPSEDVQELALELWSLQRLLQAQRLAAEESRQLAATAAAVAPGGGASWAGPSLRAEPLVLAGGGGGLHTAEAPPAALAGALLRAGPGAQLAPAGQHALPVGPMPGQEGPDFVGGGLHLPLQQRAVIEALVQEQQLHVMAQQAQRAMQQRAAWEQEAMKQRAQQLVWEEQQRAQQAQQQHAMQQRAQQLVWEEQQLAQQQQGVAQPHQRMAQQAQHAPDMDRQQAEQAHHAPAAVDQQAQQELRSGEPMSQQAQQPLPGQEPEAPSQSEQGSPLHSQQTPSSSLEPAQVLLAWLEQRQEVAASLAGVPARDPRDPQDPQQGPAQDPARAGGLGSVFWQASALRPC
ncbi:hypothetical protein N2152v2_000191 [Parachlorella kessleri]